MTPLYEEFTWEADPEDIRLDDGTMVNVRFGDTLWGEWEDDALVFHFHKKVVH